MKLRVCTTQTVGLHLGLLYVDQECPEHVPLHLIFHVTLQYYFCDIPLCNLPERSAIYDETCDTNTEN